MQRQDQKRACMHAEALKIKLSLRRFELPHLKSDAPGQNKTGFARHRTVVRGYRSVLRSGT